MVLLSGKGFYDVDNESNSSIICPYWTVDLDLNDSKISRDESFNPVKLYKIGSLSLIDENESVFKRIFISGVNESDNEYYNHINTNVQSINLSYSQNYITVYYQETKPSGLISGTVIAGTLTANIFTNLNTLVTNVFLPQITLANLSVNKLKCLSQIGYNLNYPINLDFDYRPNSNPVSF